MRGFLFDENVPMPLRFVPSLPVVQLAGAWRVRASQCYLHNPFYG